MISWHDLPPDMKMTILKDVAWPISTGKRYLTQMSPTIFRGHTDPVPVKVTLSIPLTYKSWMKSRFWKKPTTIGARHG